MLDVWPYNDREASSKELEISIACRRVLLEAGADPTAYYMVEDSYSSALDAALAEGTVASGLFWDIYSLLTSTKESLRLILDLGCEFINIEEKDGRRNTALLALLENARSNRDVYEMVETLLARGANPQSTSNHGLSCLHYCIRQVNESECSKLLVRLVEAGANPWAVDNSGLSVTAYAYDIPIEGFNLYHISQESHHRNRGMIWEQALTACDYNAAEFRQFYLDAGGRLDCVGIRMNLIRERTSDDFLTYYYSTSKKELYNSDSESESVIPESDQDSEYKGESNVSYEAGSEEPTRFDLEKGRVASSTFENEQRCWKTQDSISVSAAESTHLVLPPLGDCTQHRAARNADTGLPLFTQVLDETKYWRDTNPEDNTMAESLGSHSSNPSGTSSAQHNNFPRTDTYPTNTSSRHGNYPYQFDDESPYANTWTQHYYQMPQPQTGDAYWSYISTPHQSETPQPNTLPRIQELDLLEGDADVQIPHYQNDYVQWNYSSMPHHIETSQPNTLPRIQELDLLEGDADVWGS